MDTALLRHILDNTPVTLEASFGMAPKALAKTLEDYIEELDNSHGCEEAACILNGAIMVAKEYKDSLLLWLTSMTLNGVLSVRALEELTEVSFTLLNGTDHLSLNLADLDPDSVFYSFSKKVLPELLEVIGAAKTLFCFREYFKAPKRFKSMMNLCCIMAELNTFPEYTRYDVDIDIEQVYVADIHYGLKTLLHLAYITTLMHLTKGETDLGAVMAKWAKSKSKYPKVYRSICVALGVVDFNDELQIN